MIEIKDFWKLPASDMQSTIDDIREIEEANALEAEAVEKKMLVYKGELIQPEDYPCICDLEDPDQCYEDLKTQRKWLAEEKSAKQCFCPCHTWFEPL